MGDFSTDPLDIEKAWAETTTAIKIHNQVMRSIQNLWKIYQHQRSHKEDESEQDLLRAMLLFSCSGIDAVVKQLVQDALGSVVKHDAGAQAEFRKYAERRLRKAGTDSDGSRINESAVRDAGFLADLLTSFRPRDTLLGHLVDSLVSESLQSHDQILRIASHFAITRDEIMPDPRATREAFHARNQIAHEMDVLVQTPSGRRERSVPDMARLVGNINRLSGAFICTVDKKLHQAPVDDY